MAEPAVTFLLENVQKLLVDHINLISGAESELKQLQNELAIMKAFMKEQANKREKGEVFRQFEKQIREVVYRAENTIDACLTQAAAEKSSKFKSAFNPKGLDLVKTVKNLREKEVRPVFDRARSCFAELPMAQVSATSAEMPKDKDQKTPLVRQDNVVGFEKRADTIIQHLREESEQLEVISIIGMPGLGKTTLAWKLYRDPRIQREFPTLIWVYVSQEFNIREVLLTILKKFIQQEFQETSESTQQDTSESKQQDTSESTLRKTFERMSQMILKMFIPEEPSTQQEKFAKKMNEMSMLTDIELALKVRSYLEEQKFLLIMDDVWTVEDWNDIEAALPKNNRWGKVLITSRHAKVASRANRNREPHNLGFLDSDESWELLQLEVFGNLNECPQDLQTLGKDIAKQCGGVPLAIVVIGGILVEKYSSSDRKFEWEKIADSVTGHFKYDKQKRTENFISLSYNNLPYNLRDCFLYMGVFSEDTEIPAWKLIRLWIAEGFIQQTLERSLEEVAEDNLKDLVARNLVMVDKTKAKGDVKACRVHDMIREFCKYEAAFANQNLFQEVKKSREGVLYPPVNEILNSRRLCIHSYVLEFLRKKPKGPYVRSFLCFSKEPIILPPENIPSIPDAFNLLRVLDANPIKFTKFPTKLTQLIHLRYIALSGEDLKALPEAVSKLWNLQTIKIDTMARTFEIKANIWRMMQLRHLKTKAAIVLSREAKGEAGENLQTLSRLSTNCCNEDVFNRASNLKKLGIRGQLGTILEAKGLDKLVRLQKLKLVHDVFPHVTSENRLHRLPQPDRFPPNLKILKLSSTFLDWNHMATLGMIRSLEVLILKENAFMGSVWKAVGGGFTSLEYLHIARTDLEIWTASGDPFPELKCLVLKNCEKLEEIPSALVKNLQILDIERVTTKLVTSARKIEEGKQHSQGAQRARRGGFKLIIAPGDMQ